MKRDQRPDLERRIDPAADRRVDGTDRNPEVAEMPPGAGPELRPYQRDAVSGILASFRAGHRSTLLLLPTGGGKSLVFAAVARLGVTHGRRVLALAHRTELIDQAVAKLRAAGMEPAIEQGAQRAGDARVVVASVQTMRGARLASFAPDAFALVVVDEAHHAAAPSYTAILDHFSSARVLGVTATPDRADGEALGKVFTSVAYRYELRQAIRDGWLAPIRARRVVVDGIDLDTVHTRAGDLDRAELAAVMGAEGALHGVVAPLLELAGERPTILFAVDVAHARQLAELVNRYRSGAARALDGSATGALRAATLADFRAGAFQVLTNCALFTEGFDEPSIACVAIARPTKSRALYSQMVGRGTRLAPGKADVLVLDFTATAGRHRLVGPADVLAGAEVADDMRRELEARLTGADADLDSLMGAIETQRQQAAITAVARYRAEELDPFVGEIPAGPREPWSGDLASDRQREALLRAGLDDLPPALTKGDAKRWLDAIAARRTSGLSTLRQARFLRRHGIDGRAMTFAAAADAIDQVKAGWPHARAAAPGETGASP